MTILEAIGLSKSFGSNRANDGVHFKVQKGTIHGLIGENGAGKSTLLKMLFGHEKPDSGQIQLKGQTVQWGSPREAFRAGLGMVYQHFQLVGTLKGLDNVILGQEPTGSLGRFLPAFLQPIDRRQARTDLEPLIRQKGWQNIPLDQEIEGWPLGAWQRLEILKLLYRHCEILFLDEPTAVLAPHEIKALLDDLVALKTAGKTVVLVSHKLPEIMAVCDEVTILRQGRVVGREAVGETSVQVLASLMIGTSAPQAPKDTSLTAPGSRWTQEGGTPLLTLQGVTLHDSTQHLDVLKQISLEIFPGEILGVAGVEGNGQSPLVELLRNPKAFRKSFLRRLGLVPHHESLEGSSLVQTRGEIRLKGQSITTCDAKTLRGLGVGVIPEDRCQEGLVLEMTAWENFILGYEGHPDCQGFGMTRLPKILEAWSQACDEFDIRPRDPWLKARQFSGGNQQKIIMARELRFGPELILCCHPTRGVDFAAADLIYAQLRAAQKRGAAILLVSSSLDEIFHLADRLVVLYGGALVGDLVTRQTTPEEVGYLMTGLGHHGTT